MNRIIDYIKNPSMLLAHFIRGKAQWMSDERYLKILFKANMGYALDLKNPKTFNEKLQWLKLYNRKSEYVQMVDKASAKDYAASLIGSQYIIPTIGVWEKFDDINFDDLPNQFVMKCTHDSHTVVICMDKKNFDIEKARETIEHGMNTNYYLNTREWPYKNVKPQIIVEQNINLTLGEDLHDYKFYCFDGKPKVVCVASDRHSNRGLKIDYYDINKNRLQLKSGDYKNSEGLFKFPDRYEEMVAIAAKLSQGIPHVRVDLYCVNEKIYFGELTFFDSAGFVPLNPVKWDEIWGSWIELPEKTIQ